MKDNSKSFRSTNEYAKDYLGYNENTIFTNYGHKRTPYLGHKSIFNTIIAEPFLNILGKERSIQVHKTQHTK